MKKIATFCAVLFIFTTKALASWNIELEDYFVVFKKPVGIIIRSDEGLDCQRVVLHIIYRPNSKTELKEAVGSPDPNCKLIWTPKSPGITILSATYEDKEVVKRQVSVRFNKTPALGILVLIVAGFILYGGIIYSMRIALQQGEIK